MMQGKHPWRALGELPVVGKERPRKLNRAKEAGRAWGSALCSLNVARLGKAGQSRDIPLPCGWRKGARQDPAKQFHNSDTESTQNPRGSGGVSQIGACDSRKTGRKFLPSSPWPAKLASCGRTFFKVIYLFLKAERLLWQYKPCPERSCVLLLADPVAAPAPLLFCFWRFSPVSAFRRWGRASSNREIGGISYAMPFGTSFPHRHRARGGL